MPEEAGPELQTPQFIREILDDFETRDDFAEFGLSCKLEQAIKDNPCAPEQDLNVARAEYIAFAFDARRYEKWNTYFAPLLESGEVCDPDLRSVDHATIDYWNMRRLEAKHPVLKARYADLVWDLSKPATGLKPPIEACRAAIDEYAAAASRAAADTLHNAEDRLERALRLALSVSDAGRIEKVCDAMFDFCIRIHGDEGWVFLHD